MHSLQKSFQENRLNHPKVKFYGHINHTHLFSQHNCIALHQIGRYKEEYLGIYATSQQYSHGMRIDQNVSPIINIKQVFLLQVCTPDKLIHQDQMMQLSDLSQLPYGVCFAVYLVQLTFLLHPFKHKVWWPCLFLLSLQEISYKFNWMLTAHITVLFHSWIDA